jgi:hypothetical protein
MAREMRQRPFLGGHAMSRLRVSHTQRALANHLGYLGAISWRDQIGSIRVCGFNQLRFD